MGENKLKHLEFIQGVIIRMAGNSFLLKGWTVTLVAALFALAAKESDRRYVVVAYLPTLMFWAFDAYFLAQERRYRGLYNRVRTLEEDAIDFDMDASSHSSCRGSWACALVSTTLLLFYGALIAIMVVVMTFLH